jgi:general secretion pathway protein C
MGLDAIFKRYFPLVVCLLIGIAAYLQASGMGQLVASAVALDPSATPASPPAPRPGKVAAAQSDRATSAEAVIKRNPFDSVTGPLDAKSADLPAADAPPAPTNAEDPYEDPNCDVAKALMIVGSEDPEWSFASLAGADGKSMLRRVGDEIAGYKVEFIGDRRDAERRAVDARAVWDRVWLANGNGQRCQIMVGGKVQPKAVAAAAPAEETPKPAKGKKSKVPEEISSKIHKVSETEFNIERSVVDQILENQAELMKSARIVPEKEGDKIVGIRLFGIRNDSLLGTLGLQNGDRLGSINGFEMGDPQKALEAYAKLRTADHLTVAVNRRGKPMNIDFNIK